MKDSFALENKALSDADLSLASLEAQLRAYAGQEVIVLIDRLNDFNPDEMQEALELLIKKLDIENESD